LYNFVRKGYTILPKNKGGICMPGKILRYVIILTIFIIISFSYGYFRTFLSIKEPTKKDTDVNNIERNVSQIYEMKLNPGAKLIYKTLYVKCNDELIEEKIIGKELIGLTKDELGQIEKEWKIVSFMPDEVSLFREINDICENHFYIGIQDGYVALFQGIPGIKSILVEQTDIIADTLREDDRLILEKGLIIKDQDEFLKIREGLAK